MHHSTTKQILRMYDNGFFVWAICKDTGLSVDEIWHVLFRAGKIPIQLTEARKARGR